MQYLSAAAVHVPRVEEYNPTSEVRGVPCVQLLRKSKLSQFYQWSQCFEDLNCIAKV